MMKPLFPRKEPPYQVFWCWDISYECNYRCSYCVVDFDSKIEYLSISQWKDIWDNIYYRYGSTHIRFSGGEPFIYPNFISLLKILGEKHTLDITTNLSFDVNEFVDKIGVIADMARLCISASFHPEYVNLDDFINKQRILKKNKITIAATIVAWPSHFHLLKEASKRMKENDINFTIIPLGGRFFNREYPQAYSEEEKIFLKEVISISNSPENAAERMFEFKVEEKNRNQKSKLCRMGQNVAVIRPNGDTYRCCSWQKEHYLGNIIKGTFELLDKSEICNFCAEKSCVCYKAMVVDEENNWLPKWNWPRHKNGSYYDMALNKPKIERRDDK